MQEECCDNQIPNTGYFDCFQKINRAVGIILMPMYNSQGTVNALPMTGYGVTPFNVSGIATNTDPSQRIYPILDFVRDVNITNSDRVTKEYPDGTIDHIRDGVYSVEMTLGGGGIPVKMVGIAEKIACKRWGIFLITTDGEIIGRRTNDVGQEAMVFPIELVGFYDQGMFPNMEAKSEIKINFNFISGFKYQDLYVMPRDHFASDPLALKGLRPVNLSVVTALSTTTTKLAVNQSFGVNAYLKNNVVGLGAPAKWIVTNQTTGLAVVPAGVVEATDGTGYTFTFTPALTTGHVIDIQVRPDMTLMDGKIRQVVP